MIGVNTSRPYGPKTAIGPPLFLPGVETADQAHRVSLPVRAVADVPDFILPASARFVQLTGTVLGEDGKPAAGAHVYLAADDQSTRLIGEAVVTGSDGRFAFAAAAGASYKVIAEFFKAGEAARLATLTGVSPSQDGPPVTLRLVKR